MRSATSSTELASRVVDGDVRAIARLITRVENNVKEVRSAVAQLYSQAGRAHVVGITGVPGAGKSTLVTELAREIRAGDRKVAIIAIDPSSPFSGGAVLGDRIRMGDLIQDPNVFIRSMATRGALGGLARPVMDAVDLLDAGGFDIVLIETVGAGQDEVDIVRAAHTTVVVNAPGLGDDIQAIKAGVLEIADIHVVSKSDRPDANKTIQELKAMLTLSMTAGKESWHVPVLPTSSENRQGFGNLLGAVDEHFAYLAKSGEMEARLRAIALSRVVKVAETIIRDDFIESQKTHMERLLNSVTRRELDPHSAALEVLRNIKEDIDDV